jgi:hypothetical protein
MPTVIPAEIQESNPEDDEVKHNKRAAAVGLGGQSLRRLWYRPGLRPAGGPDIQSQQRFPICRIDGGYDWTLCKLAKHAVVFCGGENSYSQGVEPEPTRLAAEEGALPNTVTHDNKRNEAATRFEKYFHAAGLR